jgi:diguanylate cyclase (GGDEF)-like protein
MRAGRHIERREAQHTGLTLEHSFLFRIPRRVAWMVTVPSLCAIAAIEYFSPREIWFGPVYLAVLAFVAWSVSSRIAIAIGLGIMAVKLAAGIMPFYPDDAGLRLATVGTRIVAIGVVVGFIGMARRSCEREWRFARTDALTGALNRPAFFEIVESGLCRGGWCALIYADLDGLKKLNDAEGHDQGDRSLTIFAETVRKTIRKGDVFARMGGDEFVIFMKLRDARSGEAVARRLQQAINADTPDRAPRLTCSLGILLLPDGCRRIDAELRAADELMYEAKRSGSGVLVAMLEERGGDMVLSPPIAVSDRAARETALRVVDRIMPSAQTPSEAAAV